MTTDKLPPTRTPYFAIGQSMKNCNSSDWSLEMEKPKTGLVKKLLFAGAIIVLGSYAIYHANAEQRPYSLHSPKQVIQYNAK